MAKLQGGLQFTGNVNGLSAYTMQGCEGIILRKPYGPSKKEVETKASYDVTRRLNKEFGGCSTAARWIRKVLLPLRPVCDHNISAPLTRLLQPVQKLDTESAFGRRHVRLSLAPQLVEGFNLNRKSAFDAVVTNTVACTISREALQATVSLPALLPSLTFFPPGRQPYFRITFVLGVVPDLFFALPTYQPAEKQERFAMQMVQSAWYAVQQGAPALTMELQLPSAPATDAYSLMAAVGIEMGNVGAAGTPQTVQKLGCAKILTVR
jgi:hypothetical protein